MFMCECFLSSQQSLRLGSVTQEPSVIHFSKGKGSQSELFSSGFKILYFCVSLF